MVNLLFKIEPSLTLKWTIGTGLNLALMLCPWYSDLSDEATVF